jgi:hypothetical protein
MVVIGGACHGGVMVAMDLSYHIIRRPRVACSARCPDLCTLLSEDVIPAIGTAGYNGT